MWVKDPKRLRYRQVRTPQYDLGQAKNLSCFNLPSFISSRYPHLKQLNNKLEQFGLVRLPLEILDSHLHLLNAIDETIGDR
jgi:hypothetical protein